MTTEIQRQNAARAYIEKIRNPNKRAYARDYWLYLKGQVVEPEGETVSAMAAQAVRMTLSQWAAP